MLVYGDAARRRASGDIVEEIEAGLAALARMPAGLARHAGLVALFIEAASLLQGVADSEFEARGGIDDLSPAQDAVTRALAALAQAVALSWNTGFAAGPAAAAASVRLAASGLPPDIVLKRPEGYAFYGVYPEAYLAAAAPLRGREPPRVIGIRSIGTGLAAMVAAATGADPPLTLRPVGPPFRRELSLSPRLRQTLARGAEGAVAIVDEGPGLSGSSFGAAADLLEGMGAPPERLHFFPSHDGDLGPRADPAHRARWRRAKRHVVAFEELVLRAANPAHRLETWIADLVGPLTEPLQDISAGGWRRLRYADEADWPAANVQQERRKYLARGERGAFLVKFAGLGREGEAKLRRGRALAEAGFCPEVVGFRHGFLVERWIDGARALDPADGDRDRLLEMLGRYLAFRARAFPAAPEAGASLEALWTMARHNAGEVLGASAGRLDRWRPALAGLERRMHRVEVDGRLYAHEWLVLPGRLLKTDALDHHAGHDLVGCQDVAWDVAGAAVELALDPDETQRLRRAVEAGSGRRVDPELVRFCRACCLAFQLGAHALAADTLAGSPEEARLRAATAACAERLEREL